MRIVVPITLYVHPSFPLFSYYGKRHNEFILVSHCSACCGGFVCLYVCGCHQINHPSMWRLLFSPEMKLSFLEKKKLSFRSI